MTNETRLKLSSVAFAVLWTALMMWWSAPLDTAGAVILVIAGAVTGLLWYWLFGKWFRRYGSRGDAS